MTKRLGTGRQRHAVKDLRDLAADNPSQIPNVGTPYLVDSILVVPVTLSMASIVHPGTELEIEHQETFLVGFPTAFPMWHPTVEVAHQRWLGVVHILANATFSDAGLRLCIYRDVSREWHPALGVRGSIEAIWKLFDDIANGRVDRTTALFHPLGGLQPFGAGASIAVVRDDLGNLDKPIAIGSARRRSAKRIDISSRDDTQHRTLTISVPSPLVHGPGQSLQTLIQRVEAAGGPSARAIFEALKRTASHNGPGSELALMLAVSRTAASAGTGHHLVVGAIDQATAKAFASSDAAAARALERPVRIDWYRTADQREETIVRRDATRPTQSLVGLTVELLGCGAVGSWIAEYLVRAGISQITLRDPGIVGPDLLVRQNYVEGDVGFAKANQLRARLESITDHIIVHAWNDPAEAAPIDDLASRDLIVDATASESVGEWLNFVAANQPAHPMMAAVSTDTTTASLGLVAVSSACDKRGPAAIDEAVHSVVLASSEFESFHSMWRDPTAGEELVPMPGCSSPTFHGSAADAAGIAAAIVTTIAQHIGQPTSGLHLLAMPGSHHQGKAATYIEAD